MFYVGQKVVCVDDSKDPYRDYHYYPEIRPVKGETYTVREVCKNGIRLVEIVNKEYQYGNGFGEVIFRFHRFAPLETYRESYSIAIELVQQMEQVDKQKIFNPKKETV